MLKKKSKADTGKQLSGSRTHPSMSEAILLHFQDLVYYFPYNLQKNDG